MTHPAAAKSRKTPPHPAYICHHPAPTPTQPPADTLHHTPRTSPHPPPPPKPLPPPAQSHCRSKTPRSSCRHVPRKTPTKPPHDNGYSPTQKRTASPNRRPQATIP